MQNYINECFFVYLICVTFSRANPVVIQSLKQADQYANNHNYGVSSNQGIANFEADAGFNKADEKKLVNNISNARYGEQNSNKNDHLDANNFNTGTFYQKDGVDQNNFEDKKLHQKGHHKNGFHNSYHKDEVGSNSSFYDDGSDEGGHHILKNNKGTYGNAMEDNKQGNHLDHTYRANEGVNQGQFDNAHIYDGNVMNNRNYNRQQHLDDRRLADQRAGSFNSGEHYNEHRYADPPYDTGYNNYGRYNNYDTFNRDYPKRRITIFEDPRYEAHPDPVRYNDDYIELDVRPPRRYPDRSFDRRRSQHDYY
ncbi:probable serine/threonine-protein kinase clkA [Diabrotica virgifera virgifera]|uniref:Probable serine/threonine-protein kinase clkA n=1 Tax=Diabrotica virgifera virgifera TaxID=50390 RepID=A0A6P7FQD1_DIAVI|nr:probable serine/threonine-protein kinase clkA [Diabrotica virgifera virgifera]